MSDPRPNESGESPPRIARPEDSAETSVGSAPSAGLASPDESDTPAATETPDSPAASAPRTHIIRRVPVGGVPHVSPSDTADVKTGLIAPVPSEAQTGLVAPSAPPPDAPTGLIPRPSLDFAAAPPSPALPSVTTGAAILSGWATGVIATDLITSWWSSDTLFCVAVAFLASILGVATVAGVPLLLLRRRLGSLLIVAGAVASLLMFAGLFVAGASVPWVVYAIPLLPLASAVLALHPRTRQWWQTV